MTGLTITPDTSARRMTFTPSPVARAYMEWIAQYAEQQVTCERCGATMPRGNAVQLGAGLVGEREYGAYTRWLCHDCWIAMSLHLPRLLSAFEMLRTVMAEADGSAHDYLISPSTVRRAWEVIFATQTALEYKHPFLSHEDTHGDQEE